VYNRCKKIVSDGLALESDVLMSAACCEPLVP